MIVTYELMSIEHRCPWCWWCGRMAQDMPRDWGGPFLVERAHIVNNPRREDIRAVVLLCSLCHRLQHGHDIRGLDVETGPTLSDMLWMKRTFDQAAYDRGFLLANHLGDLPRESEPEKVIRETYHGRRGQYPHQ